VDIGKGIKFVRVASGIRQGEMAKRLNISQNYLSLLENNKAEPSVALLRRISKTFGVPASFLFWEDAMPLEGETREVTEKYNRIRSLVHELQELRISGRFQEATE
jgi:transcriptional regulator with XRE-family HTH domain